MNDRWAWKKANELMHTDALTQRTAIVFALEQAKEAGFKEAEETNEKVVKHLESALRALQSRQAVSGGKDGT